MFFKITWNQKAKLFKFICNFSFRIFNLYTINFKGKPKCNLIL
jgi:hypothetical protein